MREGVGDDYLIINGAIFLSEIKTYLLRSCLCVTDNKNSKTLLSIQAVNQNVKLEPCSTKRIKY